MPLCPSLCGSDPVQCRQPAFFAPTAARKLHQEQMPCSAHDYSSAAYLPDGTLFCPSPCFVSDPVLPLLLQTAASPVTSRFQEDLLDYLKALRFPQVTTFAGCCYTFRSQSHAALTAGAAPPSDCDCQLQIVLHVACCWGGRKNLRKTAGCRLPLAVRYWQGGDPERLIWNILLENYQLFSSVTM